LSFRKHAGESHGGCPLGSWFADDLDSKRHPDRFRQYGSPQCGIATLTKLPRHGYHCIGPRDGKTWRCDR
jgi:hypothetical protein